MPTRTWVTDNFSGLSHNHSLDNLSNVLTTGKSTGNVLKWNGTNWVDSTDESGSAGKDDSAANLAGAGIGVYKTETSDQMQFKRLKAGTDVTVTDNTDSITIAADTSTANTGLATKNFVTKTIVDSGLVTEQTVSAVRR